MHETDPIPGGGGRSGDTDQGQRENAGQPERAEAAPTAGRGPTPDSGVVYVLTNEGMPNLVKVGITTVANLDKRIADLSRHSGVPVAFECFFAAAVADAPRIERTLHHLFSEYRFNPSREFFTVDPEKVVMAIGIGPFEEVTPGAASVEPEEREVLRKVKARRPRIRLDALGIEPGDVLTFSRDDSVRATVLPDDKVSFEGETLSLSTAALKVLHRLGYKTQSASGSDYWVYDGELLDERRRRLEAEQFDQGGPFDGA